MQSENEATTPKQVAEWMAAQLEEAGELPQQVAAYEIQALFGDEFVCRDVNGDLGIARKVLYQFRKLTEGSVVWVAVQRNWLAGYWRKRETYDRDGRRQWYW